MKSVGRSALVATVVAAGIMPQPAAAATPSPTNIMFVGDSITEGLCDAYETFRDDALNKLAADGYLFDAIGARSENPGDCFDHPDNDHQGWAGWSTELVHRDLPADLAVVDAPDVALVVLGTNDIFYGQTDATTITDLADVIADLRAKNPKMAIVLAQIPDVEGVSSAPLNGLIVTLAASLSTTASPITTVDFNTGIGPAQLAADLIHPNAAGAAILGARAAMALEATGRISVAPTFGPYYDAEGFAEQTFTDFIGRAPTSAELASLVASLADDEANVPPAISDLINFSDEYHFRHPITRMYQAYFKRTPDAGGFDYWNDQMMALQASIPELSYLFATSEEFVLTYGSLSDAEFINLVYVNVLGREADAGGYDYWLTLMNAGTVTRPDIMVNFSESVENINTTSRRHVDTVLAYYGMLDRMPTKAELASAPKLSSLIVSIFTSDEYGQRIEP